VSNNKMCVAVAAGFGFPCVVATIFCPFHVGAALANLLFPLFIMVACGAKPLEAKSEWLHWALPSDPRCFGCMNGVGCTCETPLAYTLWEVGQEGCVHFAKPPHHQPCPAPGAN
jgi:hypothetical protein